MNLTNLYNYIHLKKHKMILIYSPSKGGDPAAGSPTATLLRLHPNHSPYLRHPPPLTRLAKMTLGTNSFRGVTGGVYKVRERIHRVVLIRDY